MDLARAFTTRRAKRGDGSLPSPQRSASTRHGGPPVQRSKISGPLELLSTTNMMSFNAPDVHSMSSSTASPTDSDNSHAFFNTPATTPEGSSMGSRPGSPDRNNLSAYFLPSRDRTSSSTTSTRQSTGSDGAPAIPQRSATHTAATHKALARKRSVSRMQAPPNTVPNLYEPSPDARNHAHPFGRELEQVNELAEEFGLRDSVVDEEEQILRRKGLKKFLAQDYVLEIQALFGGVFEDRVTLGAGWI